LLACCLLIVCYCNMCLFNHCWCFVLLIVCAVALFLYCMLLSDCRVVCYSYLILYQFVFRFVHCWNHCCRVVILDACIDFAATPVPFFLFPVHDSEYALSCRWSSSTLQSGIYALGEIMRMQSLFFLFPRFNTYHRQVFVATPLRSWIL
jgi:hypothetical protein